MPPRSSLTSSFSVTDANNEVVCPLKNNDGSNCRKRCLGEKRYRSMQEHIRRAHPNHYIPKLPATEESFLLMVNTPPEQRAQLSPPEPAQPRRRDVTDRDIYVADASSPATPRALDEPHPAAATAAVALAQLHHHRLASDWDTDMVCHLRIVRPPPCSSVDPHLPQDTHSDTDMNRDRMRSSIELPSLRDHFKQESLPPFASPRPRELLPSILNHSPPGRSSTLPPIQRREKLSRPRKSSITQSARKPRHDRPKSKEFGRRPSLGDRKALSAEPQTAAWAQGKRWEDLIEAATSATEADDERYSEAGRSPTIAPLLPSVTSAPSAQKNRSSLPPAFQSASGLPPLPPHRPFPPHSYTASPLHKSLTPPPYEGHRGRDSDLEPFPSIESSLDSMSSASGKNFPSSASGLASNSDSSPIFNLIPPISQRQHHRFSNPTPASFRNKEVQIYCAHCKRPWALNECYACTECICGVCRECVGMFISSPPTSFRSPGHGPLNSIPPQGPTSYPSARGCPRCRTVGGKWKAFQLEFR
ncbi:hypothetical protein NUU61_003818 [Penicillium alfredii]|uniref:RING zinc finger-like domain-containing protein n=1 Tax=Penicillium alfredii TaxID=1506179 RepID=A0A9W9KD86_9EURO|nr:uncharacterized protein NUU61_003818 [Penicillium alfredii]KAJ5101596.1 hypothetical protein NUU61_003818 [Penicillium alfredii]